MDIYDIYHQIGEDYEDKEEMEVGESYLQSLSEERENGNVGKKEKKIEDKREQFECGNIKEQYEIEIFKRKMAETLKKEIVEQNEAVRNTVNEAKFETFRMLQGKGGLKDYITGITNRLDDKIENVRLSVDRKVSTLSNNVRCEMDRKTLLQDANDKNSEVRSVKNELVECSADIKDLKIQNDNMKKEVVAKENYIYTMERIMNERKDAEKQGTEKLVENMKSEIEKLRMENRQNAAKAKEYVTKMCNASESYESMLKFKGMEEEKKESKQEIAKIMGDTIPLVLIGAVLVVVVVVALVIGIVCCCKYKSGRKKGRNVRNGSGATENREVIQMREFNNPNSDGFYDVDLRGTEYDSFV